MERRRNGSDDVNEVEEEMVSFAKNIFLNSFIFLFLFSTICSSEVAGVEQFHWVQSDEEIARIDFHDFGQHQVTIKGDYLGNRLFKERENKDEGDNSIDFTLFLPTEPILIQIYEPVLPNTNVETPFRSFYSYLKAHYLKDYDLYLSILDERNKERRKDDAAERKKIENFERTAQESANSLVVFHGVLQRENIYLLLISIYEKSKTDSYNLNATFSMAMTKDNDSYFITELLPDESISMLQVYIALNQKFPPEIAKHISVPPKIISEEGEQEVIQLP